MLTNNKKNQIVLILIILMIFFIPALKHEPEKLNSVIMSSESTYPTLIDAIEQVKEGAIINVYGGIHNGPIEIKKSLTLIGHDWPIIDGGNKGSVMSIKAPNITIKGFVIKNSGSVLDEENSGLSIEAPNSIIDGNKFEETLFGIYLKEAPNSIIANNSIYTKDLDHARRGDPIRLWFSHDVLLENNIVKKGRDVILWYSERLIIRGNDISEGRYGLHFMYCDDALIEKNRLVNNSVGAFLMYSRNLQMQNNFISQNRGPSGFGVGMKAMDNASLKENLFSDNRIGVSVDNSPREIDSNVIFESNTFLFNDIGLKLTPSVRRNQFKNNSFKENQEQVSIAGGGTIKDNIWTVNGIGNYWSDYSGFDSNSDGVGDIPYKSEKLFEDLMNNYPELRMFWHSPVSQSIDFAAKALPIVKPQPKLIDDAPLMKPVNMNNIPITKNSSSFHTGLLSAGMLMSLLGIFALTRINFEDKSLLLEAKKRYMNCDLQVNNLTKKFDSLAALNDVSFNIRAGESIAIWGENGAGKTTLIRCILGLLSYEGSINLGNYDAKKDAKTVKNLIGFIPQNINLHEDLTVAETMHFYSKLNRSHLGNIKKCLESTNLLEHSKKEIRQLSGGMKQRLALALAIISDPPILILDEPTANLDAKSRSAFLSLVLKFRNEGKTIIFASHRINEVMSIADKVLVFDEGRLIKKCDPIELDKDNREEMARVHLNPEDIQTGINELKNHGFIVNKNASSIIVNVSKETKIEPINILMRARIPIRDFEFFIKDKA